MISTVCIVESVDVSGERAIRGQGDVAEHPRHEVVSRNRGVSTVEMVSHNDFLTTMSKNLWMQSYSAGRAGRPVTVSSLAGSGRCRRRSPKIGDPCRPQ